MHFLIFITFFAYIFATDKEEFIEKKVIVSSASVNEPLFVNRSAHPTMGMFGDLFNGLRNSIGNREQSGGDTPQPTSTANRNSSIFGMMMTFLSDPKTKAEANRMYESFLQAQCQKFNNNMQGGDGGDDFDGNFECLLCKAPSSKFDDWCSKCKDNDSCKIKTCKDGRKCCQCC